MPLLQITDLIKTYRSPEGDVHTVLDIPTFELEVGEQMALRGGSGTGKTTLLHIIAGILHADSGRVCVGDVEVTALSEGARDAWRARSIGYVFQTFNLLQGFSALENVVLGMVFGGKADRDLAASLLSELGLGDRLHYHPRQLSIGQQQRVAVARALANRPLLVLADEPTGNLDARNADEALALLRGACTKHDAALLLVSHDERILDRFERVTPLETLNQAASGVDHG